MIKNCTKCTLLKTESEFHSYKNKLTSWCKACKYKLDAESIKKYHNKPKGIAKRLLDLAQRRSKQKQLECTITRQWIENKINLGKCEITQLPFTLDIKKGPWTPSLDRIDNTKGYTEENVKVVVCIYNFAKNQYTHQDVITLAKAIKCK